MKTSIPLVLLAVLVVFMVSGCVCGEPLGPAPSSPPPPRPTSEPAKPTTVQAEPAATEPPPAPFEISSTAYADGETIPDQYSCMGDNISPPIGWAGVPAETQGLLLFFYDPDAGFDSGASTEMGFVHWIVFNIPLSTTGYPEDVPAGDTLDDGALQGNNDFAQYVNPGDLFPGGAPIKVTGYDGPCPGNEHQYVFMLYALDTTLNLQAQVAPAEVLAAMEGHIIDRAELTGAYAPPE
jgi:Raf kinase inhibitor-like YbhB/YbcL family protein